MAVRFVKFDFDEGEPIYINPAQVTYVQQAYGNPRRTIINVSGGGGLGGGWIVPGSVGEVLEKLKFK